MLYGIKIYNKVTNKYESLLFEGRVEAEESYKILFNNKTLLETSDFIMKMILLNVTKRALSCCSVENLTHNTIRLLDETVIYINDGKNIEKTEDITFVYEGRSIAV